MSIKLVSATLAMAMAFAGPVFAQASSPVCNNTVASMAHTPGTAPDTQTSMANTSSDSGNAGSGASSASMGTGNTDKVGTNSPCAAGNSGHATGALPEPAPNTP